MNADELMEVGYDGRRSTELSWHHVRWYALVLVLNLLVLLPDYVFLNQLQMQFALLERDGNVYQLVAANWIGFYKEGLQSRGSLKLLERAAVGKLNSASNWH
jgi:hypothetical protein